MSFAVERYFAALDAFDVEALLDVYSEDARYMKPGIGRDGVLSSDLGVTRGRKAIREYLAERGPQPLRHELRFVERVGEREFFEGVLRGGETEHAFVGTATLDADGRIARYFALATPVGEESLAELAS